MFYDDARIGMRQGDLHKADDEDGSWITMNGTPVHLKDGEVDKGPQSVKDHVAAHNNSTRTTESGLKLEVKDGKMNYTTKEGKSGSVDLYAETRGDKKGYTIIGGKIALKGDDAKWAKDHIERNETQKRETLERNVPGLQRAQELQSAAANERGRYQQQMNRMFDTGHSVLPSPENASHREALNSHLEQHPRAALYLRAQGQRDSSSWADNTGKGSAGEKAMGILRSGGKIEDARAALNERREFND